MSLFPDQRIMRPADLRAYIFWFKQKNGNFPKVQWDLKPRRLGFVNEEQLGKLSNAYERELFLLRNMQG